MKQAQSLAALHRPNLVTERRTRRKDFLIFCPKIAENSGVLEAIFALYYLPQNYKLVIGDGAGHSSKLYKTITTLMREPHFLGRITFYETHKTGNLDEDSPFSFADAVVYGSSDPMYTKNAAQTIIVFDIADNEAVDAGGHNFTVSASSPEALASAILQVAQNCQKY